LNPRTTGILFLVALALGAFVYFYEIRGGEARQEAEERARRLFPAVESGQIDWISLTTHDGKTARAERRDEGWRVVAPVDFPGDAPTLDGMADALADLKSEAVIDEPQAAAVYGLGDDAEVVSFGSAGADHQLRLGHKTPVGANTYASTDAGPGVFTVESFRATRFEKSLDDLRDRRPLRFDRENVARLELSWRGGGVVLARDGDRWHLVEPLEADADPQAVESFLSDLIFLRASGFVDDPAADTEATLDDPDYRVVVVEKGPAEGEPARWEVDFGGLLDGSVRVARGQEHSLYQIPEERYKQLPRRVSAFRVKTLARFVPSDATRFELVFHGAGSGEAPAETIVGERGASGWTTSPESMAAGRATTMLERLSHLSAADIAAESMGPKELAGAGLAPPHAVVRVFGAVEPDAEPAPLAAVDLGAAQSGHVYARVPGRDTIYLLDYDVAEDVPISLEAFRNRFLTGEQTPAAAPAQGSGSGAPDAGD
jgi:hypothetical protein